MSYRRRLTLMVTALLLVTVTAVSGLLAWSSHRAMLEEAEMSGQLVAKVLARSAVLARQLPREMEDVVGDMMVSAARIAGRLIAESEAAGRGPGEIAAMLEDIVRQSTISEFWITDRNGHAYLHSLPGVDFTFDPDPAKQPQAHAFWPLLTGKADRVVQEARKREIDNRVFKYVGVPGVDGPRIVQLGVDVGFLEAVADRVGLHRMVKSLLAGGDINAIWVIGNDLETIAHASVYGSETNPQPDEAELALLREVLAAGETDSRLRPGHLAVAAPVIDEGRAIGLALVRLPTDKLRGMLHSQTRITLVIVLIALAVGALVSVLAAQRVTGPVTRVTEAAMAMEARSFKPEALADTAARPDEIGRLAAVFRRMAADVLAREEQLDGLVRERTRDLEAKTDLLVQAHHRIDEELKVAQALQIAMLPTDFLRHPRYEMFGLMAPAREVGGDFYDFVALDGRHVLVTVGDVSGKGVPAAFFMVLTRTLMQNMASAEGSPGTLLAQVNDRLCRSNPQNLFVTVFCAILDTATGDLRYANGGHNPPLRLGADGTISTLPSTGDMALGVMDGETYREVLVQLGKGETLFLYTDGLTEAFAPDGSLFGEARLAEVMRRSRSLSMQALVVEAITAVESFAAGLEQADDATCLALRFKGEAPTETA
ncbi:MAG: SpoIIE family protein phosphatase [Magnetospirillum sp. WYHS-4]